MLVTPFWEVRDPASATDAGSALIVVAQWSVREFPKMGLLHSSYILFNVLFQTKCSLVWKSYSQKLRTIFQTNSSLVWKQTK